jgi:hypothetical protein
MRDAVGGDTLDVAFQKAFGGLVRVAYTQVELNDTAEALCGACRSNAPNCGVLALP